MFSDLALTNIQFKVKETVLSKFQYKLWLGAILVVIQCETLLTFFLPCVEALLILKQWVDLSLYILIQVNSPTDPFLEISSKANKIVKINVCLIL